MSQGEDTRPDQPEQPPEPTDAERLERKIHDQPTVAPGRWVKRIVLALVLVIVLYLAWRLSAAFFPRWWAQRVADQVQGRMTAGVLWGLFYGFTFTFVPLLLLFQIRRRFFTWAWRGVVAVVAVLLALPNLLTLSIVIGISNAADAGDSIMDVDAPGFRWSTLYGAIIGALLAMVITGTSMRLSRRKKQVDQLKQERDELKKARDAEEKPES